MASSSNVPDWGGSTDTHTRVNLPGAVLFPLFRCSANIFPRGLQSFPRNQSGASRFSQLRSQTRAAIGAHREGCREPQIIDENCRLVAGIGVLYRALPVAAVGEAG